ncbi:MAG: hypothetical protein NC417_06340 [Candidatus Gastranaerophilales bacterium]|nr:hypothetical protein [Candidatus Gastranaerophilales bacterium]
MKTDNNRWNKILFWKPSVGLIALGMAAAMLLALIPLLRLAMYAVPWYDDWNYGKFARAGMEMAPGIVGALKGTLEGIRVEWYAWQGTFSSIFFMMMMPAIWGEQYYFLGPVFLILILTVSVFVLTSVLTRDVFGLDRYSRLAIQGIVTIMVVELIYTAQAGFYWYNGGVHYVGMHSFFMLFVAALCRLYHTELKSVKGILLLLASLAGALLTAGSNFVTALQGLVVLFGLTVAVLWTRRGRGIRYLPALAVYAVSFYMNVSAPGNQVRARSYEGWGYSPFWAVLRSFLEAFRHLWEFTGWMTLAFLLLLFPIIWQAVGKSKFSFRFPLLVLVGAFCLYATGFTPSLYSLGHAGLSRSLNAVKITYQILLILNEIYWIGWARRMLERRGGHINCPEGAPWWYYGAVIVCMLVIFSLSSNQAGSVSSYGAYYYVHTGEAYNFYHEYMARVEILKSDEKDVVLEPYHFKPWFLCMGDLTDDPDREENRAVAEWYDKNTVIVKE